jgi:hypothetical protein
MSFARTVPGSSACAQNDGKNLQRQGRATARTNNSKDEKQIPFGDDNQRDNGNGKTKETTATAKQKTKTKATATVTAKQAVGAAAKGTEDRLINWALRWLTRSFT